MLRKGRALSPAASVTTWLVVGVLALLALHVPGAYGMSNEEVALLRYD